VEVGGKGSSPSFETERALSGRRRMKKEGDNLVVRRTAGRRDKKGGKNHLPARGDKKVIIRETGWRRGAGRAMDDVGAEDKASLTRSGWGRSVGPKGEGGEDENRRRE